MYLPEIMPKKGKRGHDAVDSSGTKKKSRRKGPKKGSDHVPEYASDEERLYGKQDDPDPESREYFYDDIDEFHANREKILVNTGYKAEEVEESDEEEVLALESEESDDEEIRNLKAQLRKVKQLQKTQAISSDLEDASEEDEEEGLPDNKAWGSKRSKYYGDDDIDMQDMEDEDAEAVLEEKEALRLQKQMAEQLDDQDFGLDIFQPAQKAQESSEKEERIIKDLSKMSKREKLKVLKKESPELFTLIDEFKDKMTEVQERLCPLKEWIEKKQLSGKAVDYVNTKLRLNLSYCTNIVFYLMLKSKQAPVHNHPVIKRLLQYRNIMKQLEPLDVQMKAEVDEIVEKLSLGEDVEFNKVPERTFVRRKRKSPSKPETQKKSLSDLALESDSGGSESDDMYEDLGATKQKKADLERRYETKDEKAALEYYEMMKAGRPDADNEEDDNMESFGEEEADVNGDEELDEDSKRAISYQIEKNKGLTAHKKKELRNPRVKHRMKYRKAKIRRKGQFREPRTEVQRYGGEISGIRAGVKRGVKLK